MLTDEKAAAAPVQPLTDAQIAALLPQATGANHAMKLARLAVAEFCRLNGFTLAATPAQAAPAPQAAEHWQLERMRHIANEWADMAVNGLQWLRNVRDGTSTVADALANMEKCLAHCRHVNDAPGPYGATAAPAPAVAAPVQPLTTDADEAALYRWLRDTTHPDNLRKLFNGCQLPGAAEIRAAAGITATPPQAAPAPQAEPAEGYRMVKLKPAGYRTRRGAVYGATTVVASDGATTLYEVTAEAAPAAPAAVQSVLFDTRDEHFGR